MIGEDERSLLPNSAYIPPSNPVRSSRFDAYLYESQKQISQSAKEANAFRSRKQAAPNRKELSFNPSPELIEASKRSEAGAPADLEEAIAQLFAFLPDPRVLEPVLTELQSHLAGNAEAKDKLRKSEALAPIIEAMDRHPDSLEVQKAACSVIWSASSKNLKNKAKFCEFDAAETITNALQAFPDSASLHIEAMGALLNLAMAVDGNRNYIMDASGIEAGLAALQKFPDETRLVQLTIGFLFTMAANVDCRAHIVQLNGIEAVIKILKLPKYSASKDIIKNGIGFLKNVVNSPANHERLLTIGVDKLVRNMAVDYSSDEKISSRIEYVLGRLKMDTDEDIYASVQASGDPLLDEIDDEDIQRS